MAFMGFAAVLQHWKDVQTNFRIAHEALLKEQPDVLILIDYPSFNLRMAAFCKRHLPQTKIIYYIPPKVWAWKRRRVHKIAKLCDEVLGIFPFEPAFYARYGYRCTYVGNPTAEEIRRTQNTEIIVPKGKEHRTCRCNHRYGQPGASHRSRGTAIHPLLCHAERTLRLFLGRQRKRKTYMNIHDAPNAGQEIGKENRRPCSLFSQAPTSDANADINSCRMEK